MGGTAARFTLDETKARAWLTRSMRAHETCDAKAIEREHLPDIDDDYRPQDDYESGSATAGLVYLARLAGVLTGPGNVEFDFSADSDGPGYTWLLYLGGERCGPELRLADAHEDLRNCGDRDAAGTTAALAVLREARDAGNRLLDDLAAYTAARAGAR
jgi:hypothetical protein